MILWWSLALKKVRSISILALVFVAITSCHQDKPTLFRQVSSAESGIHFANNIAEDDSINILQLEYIYNGGGVAAADFNNDGLTDLFFTGNQVSNKLYLNRGDFHFEDVTKRAGLDDTAKWRSGVAIADVNEDGLVDIYLCATIKKDTASLENMLFINKGLLNGVPVFKDEAKQFGVADAGHSQHAAFLDYDLDGDLDLYILTNSRFVQVPSTFRKKITDGSSVTTDRLYRNNGNNTFTNVSNDAGITIEGYGLGVAIADFNNDRYPDIYVSNDYLTNDILYINNQDGTFTNRIAEYMRHQSQFSMGNDVADINNDALPDLITLDMLPEGNLRRKTVINGGNYISYVNAKKFNYEHQYLRNMLQLNNGNGTFSEIGQLAGVHQTEWSWSPLMADFDNDGYRDLIITNGFPKDVTDKDFSNYRLAAGRVLAPKELLDSIPVVKVSNYAFKNNGDLTFSNTTWEWGLHSPAFSNGAAFADFDNDGDLDYVVNNINQDAFIYENTLNNRNHPRTQNFIRIKLKGTSRNSLALGTKVYVQYGDGKIQYHDHSIYRGYLSSVDNVVHFGLGADSIISTLKIIWPDGKMTKMSEVPANQTIVLSHSDDASVFVSNYSLEREMRPTIFKNISEHFRYIHQEEDRIDFNLQRTLPHKYSQYGPGMAVADVNGDGLDDYYITGAAGKPGHFFMQDKSGEFVQKEHMIVNKTWEDLGAVLFDADNDGDQDLFTVSGSIEWLENHQNYLDHLYINDGKGNFQESAALIPPITSSGSCVRAADFDGDSDLDLFVGGRVVPGKYPVAARSSILVNSHGKFSDDTEQLAKDLTNIGMITDALWTDFNTDGKIDLVVVGELMPVTFFQNTGTGFRNITSETNTENHKGWWNSIAGGDFDGDGDIDYVVGNVGRNHYYKASPTRPVQVIAKDFDGNGSIDPIISCYFLTENGKTELCPVHFWDELNSLSPKFRQQFSRYHQYGVTTTEKLLSPHNVDGAIRLEGNYSETSYFENTGNGKFKIRELPSLAQISCVNGMVAGDFNHDSHQDLLITGNDYGNEVFSGRLDASIGLLLTGDGEGNFIPINSTSSGFVVKGDAKALVNLFNKQGQQYIVASQNQDSLKVFKQPEKYELFEPATLDKSIEFILENGTRQKIELYYGGGFLSQSSRKLIVPTGTVEIIAIDSRNQQRKIDYREFRRE